MIRLVVFGLLFWVGWQLWRIWGQKNQASDALRHEKEEKKYLNSETMVPCAQCGIHLPQSSAIYAAPYHFCCKAHQKEFDQEN